MLARRKAVISNEYACASCLLASLSVNRETAIEELGDRALNDLFDLLRIWRLAQPKEAFHPHRPCEHIYKISRSGAAIRHPQQPALDLTVKKFGKERAAAAWAEFPESLSDVRDTRRLCDDETTQAQTARRGRDRKIAGADLLKHLIRRPRCRFFRSQPLKDRLARVAGDRLEETLLPAKQRIQSLPRPSGESNHIVERGLCKALLLKHFPGRSEESFPPRGEALAGPRCGTGDV
jgi:hypothetical protein